MMIKAFLTVASIACLFACGSENDQSDLKSIFALGEIAESVDYVESFSDMVQRNEAITDQYHQVSEALNHYLNANDDQQFPNWFSFGQHASHQAGTYMHELQKVLPLFALLHGSSRDRHDPRKLLDIVNALKKLSEQKDLVGSFVKLYLAKTGINLEKGLFASAPAILIGILNPIILREDLLKVEASLQKLQNGLGEVNLQVFKSVTPSAFAFLAAAARGSVTFDGQMNFDNDDDGIKQGCYQLYFQVASLSNSQKNGAERRLLAHQANVLLGIFEQMTAQPGLEEIRSENEILKGSLKIVDPIGTYSLLNDNWSNYEIRMALQLDQTIEYYDLTPEFILHHVDDQIAGTIPGYFQDRTFQRFDKKIFQHPGAIL